MSVPPVFNFSVFYRHTQILCSEPARARAREPRAWRALSVRALFSLSQEGGEPVRVCSLFLQADIHAYESAADGYLQSMNICELDGVAAMTT